MLIERSAMHATAQASAGESLCKQESVGTGPNCAAQQGRRAAFPVQFPTPKKPFRRAFPPPAIYHPLPTVGVRPAAIIAGDVVLAPGADVACSSRSTSALVDIMIAIR